MNNQIHEFDPKIYPRRVWVTCDCDPAALNDLFPEGGLEGKPFEKLSESSDAYVDIVRRYKPDTKAGVLIRFDNKKAMTAPVIAHEAVHAALEIFSYCGCKITDDNQEPFAYLVGWIVKCCEQVKTGKYDTD